MNEHLETGPVAPTPDNEHTVVEVAAEVPTSAEPAVVGAGAPAAGAVSPEAPVTLPVDPARSAAGRRGGERFHELARLGREYEREHKLTPGRQRLKQLVQLGRRYEQEHGLAPKPRRRRGDPWQEFLAALARVVKPAHRPAVEQLAAALRQAGKSAA